MWLSNAFITLTTRTLVLPIIIPACLGVLVACGLEEIPEPVLEETCLSDDKTNCIKHAKNDAEIKIELRGKNFFIPYELSLDDRDVPSPIGEFKAWLGTQPILNLSQEPMHTQSQHTLTGRLPALLPSGLYDTKLSLPSGQEVVLKEAFRIVGP